MVFIVASVLVVVVGAAAVWVGPFTIPKDLLMAWAYLSMSPSLYYPAFLSHSMPIVWA